MSAPQPHQLCRCGHEHRHHHTVRLLFTYSLSCLGCSCPEFRPVETGETLTRKGIKP